MRGKGASPSWLGLVLPLWLVKEKGSQILVSVTTPSKGCGLVLSPSAFTFETLLIVQASWPGHGEPRPCLSRAGVRDVCHSAWLCGSFLHLSTG